MARTKDEEIKKKSSKNEKPNQQIHGQNIYNIDAHGQMDKNEEKFFDMSCESDSEPKIRNNSTKKQKDIAFEIDIEQNKEDEYWVARKVIGWNDAYVLPEPSRRIGVGEILSEELREQTMMHREIFSCRLLRIDVFLEDIQPLRSFLLPTTMK